MSTQAPGASPTSPGGEPAEAERQDPGRNPGAEQDSPWKEALDRWLDAFVLLLLPDLHAEVDWSQGWEALDAELQAVVRDAELGRRLADRLYRVRLRDGQDAVLYVHVEVQGQAEADFARRMFRYAFRLVDRYDAEVVSLAVLVDDDPAWRPRVFASARAGCSLRFEFPVAKLLDWDAPEARARLEADPSPAAVVVLAQLDALRTRRDPMGRREAKWTLYRGLFERGLSRGDILELFRVLDWLLALPPPLERELAVRIAQHEEEGRMPYVTSIERIGREKGFEEGREKGLEEGREKGLEEALRLLLATRWGPLAPALEARLRAAVVGPDFAEVVAEASRAPSLEAFAAWLDGRARGGGAPR